ncbi:MAG: PAS domain S-box protein [Bacteroidota bacterium]
MSNTKSSFELKKGYVLILIGLIIIITSIGGYFLYKTEEASAKFESYESLRTIAKLKTDQILKWKKERLSEAEFFSKSTTIIKLFQNRNDVINNRKLFEEKLSIIQKNHEYSNIYLVTDDLKILHTLDSSFTQIEKSSKKNIERAFAERKTIFHDFSINEKTGKIELEMIAPIIGTENSLIGGIAFLIDPEQYLFPLIQTWPTSSKTAETLLIREEKDSIVYLNELRHKKNTALKLKISKNEKNLPSVKAVDGYKGIFEGIDYRGVHVLSYITHLEGTNWYMVAKIDKNEIFSSLYLETGAIILSSIILILLTSTGLFWLYHFRQRNLYRAFWKSQEEYKTALFSIGDAVITTDTNGIIKQVNKAAQELMECSEEELINKDINSILKLVDEDSREELINPVKKLIDEGIVHRFTNNTLLITNKGRELPVLDRGASIKNDSGDLIEAMFIFSDLSDKREKQYEIIRLNRIFALLSRTNQAIVRIKNKKELFSEICNIAIEEGKFELAFIGLLNKDLHNFKIITLKKNECNKDLENFNEEDEKELCECLIRKIPSANNYLIINDLTEKNISLCHKLVSAKNLNSAVFFVIEEENKVIGIFGLFSKEKNYFQEDEIKLLLEMTADVSFTIDSMANEIKRKESEEKYKRLTENAQDLIYRYDFAPKRGFTYVNPIVEQFTGYSQEDHYNDPGLRSKIVHPEDRNKLEKYFEDKDSFYKTTILRWIKKDGTIIWTEQKNIPVYNENKELVAIEGIARDITQRMKAEEELRKSEEKYRASFGDHSAVKLLIDLENGNIIDANTAAVEYYGWAKEDLMKMNFDQINILPKEAMFNEMDDARTLKKIHFEMKHRRAGGIISDVEVYCGKIVIDGKDYLQSIIHDITDKKLAEVQLQLLNRAVEQTPVSVLITDVNGNIEYANPKFSEVSGYSFEEVKGKNPRILQSGFHTKEFYKEMWDTLLARKNFICEILNKKINGELYWENAVISPIINYQGTITHFVAIKENITEKKKMFEELVKAKEEAEKSNKLKSEFLAQMSHEIRTPIHIVTSSLTFIKENLNSKLEAEDLELFDHIDISAKRIIRTIDLVLNVSEMQLGIYKPNFSVIDLDKDILTKVVNEHKLLALKKNLKFIYNFLPENVKLISDEYCLTQIFANLIDNAIKYTKEGIVEVKVSRDEKNEIVVEIKDTGIGMSKEFLDHLFEPFKQEYTGYSREYEGIGLGLALVKKYCELINAKIEVKSQKGTGTIFTIVFQNI